MRIWEYKINWFRFFFFFLFFFFFTRLMMICAHLWVNKWEKYTQNWIFVFLTLMRALCSGVRVLRYANWFPLLQPKLPNAVCSSPDETMWSPESHTRFRVCGPDQTRPDQTTAMHHGREQRTGGYQGPVLRDPD